ncbi:MarR family winged helix-turn-helix transcriptional regulator [Catenuloplanes sp. NPDC051500]|uniref:MarR family winged helix-turn-helix transcriptional regulator n=1 Tax=Catenuloplanes sp. NPDC051500 TaxID=3363959 RepID=UPI00379FC046
MSIPLPLLLSMAFRLFTDRLHARLADEGHAEIRPAHGYAISRLVTTGGETAVELAGYLGVTKQGAAHIIRELETWGYAERARHPTDGRAQLIVATARGRALVARVAEIWAEEESHMPELDTVRTALRSYVDENGDGRTPMRPVW